MSASSARPRALPLLLEIGCEEIPARFLTEAERSLGGRVYAALDEARLVPSQPRVEQSEAQSLNSETEGPLQTFSTPRRLVVYLPEVLERQVDKVEEVLGPPVKVALDSQGKFTRAAESFAQKNAVGVGDLTRVTTAKGEYLVLRKTIQGRSARELLPEILPPAILGLSFPKSMYWVAKSGPRFVRPIRWVLALLGEGSQAGVMPFQIAGVKSSDSTYGPRALGKRPLRVTGLRDYRKRLRQAHVEVHPQRRREAIVRESKVLLENRKITLVQDEALLDWIVNSCEWPRAILGGFDKRFLHLPREILVTVMRDHQKYFAIEDGRGNLQPHFIAVLNMDTDAKGLIRQGHERVLRARFSDAEFFWDADQRVTLRNREALLSSVTYQVQLGSYADKVKRMRSIGASICSMLEEKDPHFSAYSVLAQDAISLCKCDLTTQVVQEFPELQGVVGGLYARHQGLPSEVAEAIYDHYLPQGAEDRCPRSLVGAVVSVADKLDSVVGGFAVGREPTGSSDPFALRRQANGIVKVLLEFRLPIGLRLAVEQAVNVLNIPWPRPQMEVFRDVMEFFEERLRYYLEVVRSFRYDTVRAVLAAGWDVPVDALARAEGLEAIRGGENFEALSVAAKRIKNILTKSATEADWEPGEVDTSLLKENPEEELYGAYGEVAEEAGSLGEVGKYRQALEAISSLRPTVDRFFDKVLVMAEDSAVRRNRLRLLGKLDALFSGIAQFAEIAASPEAKTASGGRSRSLGKGD